MASIETEAVSVDKTTAADPEMTEEQLMANAVCEAAVRFYASEDPSERGTIFRETARRVCEIVEQGDGMTPPTPRPR